MANVRTISHPFRFLVTAVTLLCVLLLNHQEITTYRPAPVKLPGTNTQLHKSAQKQAVVKQKVSFEATTSYLLMPLAQFTDWLPPVFSRQFSLTPVTAPKTRQGIFLFAMLCASTIVPNAP